MINKCMYYIYAYIDPRNNLPFYIGKGKGERKFDHLSENTSKKENKEKFKIIQELLSLGLAPIITELESNISNELLAYNREDFYILSYGRKGIEPNGILTNRTIGGKHPPVPVWDSNRKQQHSEWNKNYWTEERKFLHKTGKGNGGVGTVSVTDINGNNKRISKADFDNMDRSIPIDKWVYVSVSSNEAKRRRDTLRTVIS